MNTEELRRALVDEAKTWLNTPYHHCAKIKGVGVDCICLLAAIAESVGIVESVDIPEYSPQWHLHQRRELLLEHLKRYCDDGAQPLPGNIATFFFGHAYSHSALIVEWPTCIHASMKAKRVEYVDALQDPQLVKCTPLFWQPFALGRLHV